MAGLRRRAVALAAAGWVLALLGGGAVAAEAAQDGREYRPYEGIARGTEGVVAVPLAIRNEGPEAMVCAASLAHWYTETLGTVGPGETLRLTFWHDAATGSLALLNAVEDRMPVEAVRCGPPGTPHAARIALPFRAGAAPAEIARRCGPAPVDGAFRCEAVEGEGG